MTAAAVRHVQVARHDSSGTELEQRERHNIMLAAQAVSCSQSDSYFIANLTVLSATNAPQWRVKAAQGSSDIQRLLLSTGYEPHKALDSHVAPSLVAAVGDLRGTILREVYNSWGGEGFMPISGQTKQIRDDGSRQCGKGGPRMGRQAGRTCGGPECGGAADDGASAAAGARRAAEAHGAARRRHRRAAQAAGGGGTAVGAAVETGEKGGKPPAGNAGAWRTVLSRRARRQAKVQLGGTSSGAGAARKAAAARAAATVADGGCDPGLRG